MYSCWNPVGQTLLAGSRRLRNGWTNSWVDSLSHLFAPFWSTLLGCESQATNFLYPISGGKPCLSRPPYPGQ